MHEYNRALLVRRRDQQLKVIIPSWDQQQLCPNVKSFTMYAVSSQVCSFKDTYLCETCTYIAACKCHYISNDLRFQCLTPNILRLVTGNA